MKLAVIVVFLLLTVGSALVSWWLSQRKQQRDANILERSIAGGLIEPPSLHPIIDPHACIGTAACVSACPEGGILGIVNGRAALIEPSRCIGHGACFAACPTHAIELVFGTERRGIEIPHVKSDFETNVHGLYIAGELGGMGLVRNAMSQGAKALEAIASGLAAGPKHDLEFDVAIIGAGPAGIAASLAAKRAGLRTVTLEQDAIGGTVYHYPREKMVITRPIDVPGYGRIEAREIQKDELLRIWQDVIRTTGIEIRVRERVETVKPVNGGFVIETASGRYRAARTILAVGRRGSPRKLGVAGEELPHVTYSLGDPTEVSGKSILVVGGGNTALEAAIELSDPQLDNIVTLSYRGGAFGRATQANRQRIEDLAHGDRLTILTHSEVMGIEPAQVSIRQVEDVTTIPTERVYIMIGGKLPTELLQGLGVTVDVKFGAA
jgi:thioredoxin reductase (NADPH)